MDLERLKSILREDEGLRLTKYKCTAGVWTIGYGHTGSVPDECTVEEAERWLEEDIFEALSDAYHLCPDIFGALSENRQIALACMVFQLGFIRTARFKKLLKALRTGKFQVASSEMLDSKWHKQTPERCERIAKLMREG